MIILNDSWYLYSRTRYDQPTNRGWQSFWYVLNTAHWPTWHFPVAVGDTLRLCESNPDRGRGTRFSGPSLGPLWVGPSIFWYPRCMETPALVCIHHIYIYTHCLHTYIYIHTLFLTLYIEHWTLYIYILITNILYLQSMYSTVVYMFSLGSPSWEPSYCTAELHQ